MLAFQQPELMSHQQLAKEFIFRNRACGLFLDVGCGKTLTVLDAFYEMNLPYHILVIAPKTIARSTWIDEIAKWQFPIRTKSLIVNAKGNGYSRKKRLELYQATLDEPPTVYFINRELVQDLCDNLPLQNDKPIWPFGIVIIDEIQGFKSYAAERFKALKKQLPYIQHLVGLTGTPTPKDLMDLWPEIFLMDGGQRLGKNITAYRENFFTESMHINGRPVSWDPKPGAEDEIYRRISDIVISVKNTVLDLPELTYNSVRVHMTDKEYALYREFMKTQVLTLVDDVITAANAAVLQNKLSQMASGSIYLNADTTTGKKREYAIIHKEKLVQCQYIIENTGSPILIAYHFRSDKEMLLDYLPQAQAFNGTPEMIHDWNKGLIPVMLIQPASAGHGLNLQDGGHTLIWYTLSWSLEAYLQTNARLYRKGQTQPVIIHHLLTDKTVDDKILKALKRKDISERALLDAVELTITDCVA